MPENQGHGKTWEKDLGMNVYKATEAELNSVSYTAAIDVPRGINHLDGIDVSIKVSGGDAIDMGDIIRVYKEVSSGEPIHMTVVSWEQKNNTKKLTSIIEVDLTNSVKLLFGTAKLSDIQELVNYVKAIPNHGRTAEHQKTYKQMAATLKETHGGWISYACKVDSKVQRRVQGHFSKFNQFVKENPILLIAESKTGEFRGGKITEEIVSTPRSRNARPTPDSTPHSPPL